MHNHELKIDPLPFELMVQRLKTFEIRKDDRDFHLGDTLTLRETKYSAGEMAKGLPLEFSGRYASCTVTHLLRAPTYGVPEGYVVMSVRLDLVGSMPGVEQ